MIQVESGYDPSAVSRKGAIGLMQLMPATAAMFDVSDPFDPEQNIGAGTAYMRQASHRLRRPVGAGSGRLQCRPPGGASVRRHTAVSRDATVRGTRSPSLSGVGVRADPECGDRVGRTPYLPGAKEWATGHDDHTSGILIRQDRFRSPSGFARSRTEMINLPNVLSLFRILLVPLLVAVLLTKFEGREYVGLMLFLLASLTDFLDGFLARRQKKVTRLGKLLDPAADKILTSAAFIALVELDLAPAWMVVAIVGREFAVSTLRSVIASEQIVVAATVSGKIKTITQIVAISALIIKHQLGQFSSHGSGASVDRSAGQCLLRDRVLRPLHAASGAVVACRRCCSRPGRGLGRC